MWYVLLLAACVAGDQLLKWWVTAHLEMGQSAPLLPGVVQLTRLHNTGAAWSSFSGKTGAAGRRDRRCCWLAVAWLLVKKIVRHPLGVTAGAAGPGRRHRQHHRPRAPGLCGGYVRPAVLVSYPVFNLADLLRGGGRHSGRCVLPVVLRKIRQGRSQG